MVECPKRKNLLLSRQRLSSCNVKVDEALREKNRDKIREAGMDRIDARFKVEEDRQTVRQCAEAKRCLGERSVEA